MLSSLPAIYKFHKFNGFIKKIIARCEKGERTHFSQGLEGLVGFAICWLLDAGRLSHLLLLQPFENCSWGLVFIFWVGRFADEDKRSFVKQSNSSF